ncbi:hypothetical protein [Peribacillus acanthi]|uniref:hypothetical protein n=1 Tax=Peribacillus acanthi TaxID=2171554 RepID=UPI000D3E6365|nr:hypothetical protein [Peribacillus acanthi]
MAKEKAILNDGEMDKITDETGKLLAAQPKVRIKLPLSAEMKQKLEAQEKAGKNVEWPFHPVQVNGYIYQIQLGKTVEVPETVADILEQAGLI